MRQRRVKENRERDKSRDATIGREMDDKKKQEKEVPESMRACFLAAASSMRRLGMPSTMALDMPPSASTYTAIRATHRERDRER
jgi:hypothetical protein